MARTYPWKVSDELWSGLCVELPVEPFGSSHQSERSRVILLFDRCVVLVDHRGGGIVHLCADTGNNRGHPAQRSHNKKQKPKQASSFLAGRSGCKRGRFGRFCRRRWSRRPPPSSVKRVLILHSPTSLHWVNVLQYNASFLVDAREDSFSHITASEARETDSFC